jgi:hypothetical protein
MAKSGDDVAMAKGRYNSSMAMSMEMSKSEPVPPAPPLASAPLITGWNGRHPHESSPASTPGVSLKLDERDAALSGRGRKRSANEDIDMDSHSDNALHGMDVLAESASRLQEAEREEDAELIKGGIIIQPTQPGAGPKYACAYCAKTFSRPSSLRIHTYSRESIVGCGRESLR